MEPVETPIRTLYSVYTSVIGVKSSDGKVWDHFDGSRESLAFPDPESFAIGDKVKITFEKVP